jgi:hypothetical protein
MVLFSQEDTSIIRANIDLYVPMGEDFAIEDESAKTLFALMGVEMANERIFMLQTESDEIYNSPNELWSRLWHNWSESETSWLEQLTQAPSVNPEPLEGVYGGFMFAQYMNEAPTVLFIADDRGMERVYFRESDFNKLFPIK